MMDVLKNYQLGLMLMLVGACGVIALLTLFSGAIPKGRRRILIALELCEMLLLFSDFEAYRFRGNTTALGYYMVRISNFLVFAMVILAIFIFSRYLQNLYLEAGAFQVIPKRLRISDFLCAVAGILLIVSQFTGLYYTFDETNQYQRSPGYPICYLLPLLILCLLLSVILQYHKQLNRSVWVALFLFSFTPLVASTVQLFLYGLSLTNIATTGLAIAVYIIDLRNVNKTAQQAYQILEKKQEENHIFIEEMTQSFANIIDMRDHYTNGHSHRVAQYTVMLAREMGYDETTVEKFKEIALLHDIGKIGIDESLLNKPGALTPEEYQIIQSHSQLGYDALKNISIMPDLAVGAKTHHERPDGKGYPNHLKGNEIPGVGRILGVADTFDAMYSDRPYRKRMNFDKAVSIIRENSGKQFDEEVVNAFLRLVDRGEFRALDDTGGGSMQEVDNLAVFSAAASV